MKSLRVYIAGPMTNGGRGYDMWEIHEAIGVYFTLIELGHTPYCPQLSVFCEFMAPDRLTHAGWLELDERYIDNSDVVLRLPGESIGADHECAYAEANGIPVAYGIDNLIYNQDLYIHTE